MALNKRYGKTKVNGDIEYAPRSFYENDSLYVPRVDDDEAYFDRGWYKVVNVKPAYDAVTQYVSIKQWTTNEDAKTVTAEYNILKRPEDTRKKAKKYSKLRMTLFCMEQDIWTDVKEFLEKTGYYDLFVMAQYFLDTDEYYQKGIQMFKDAYVDERHTAEDIDAMVESMENFAFDGYEILDEEADEVLDESTSADNAGL